MGELCRRVLHLLLVLLAYVSCGAAVGRSSGPGSDQPLLRSWMDVNVHVAGFTNSPLVVSELQDALQSSMPQYSPPITPSSSSSLSPSSSSLSPSSSSLSSLSSSSSLGYNDNEDVLQYDLRFTVKEAPRLAIGMLTTAAEDGEVEMDALVDQIVERLPWLAKGADNWNIVNVLLMWEAKLPKHRATAGPTSTSMDCIQTWISKHNLLVADLAAEGCDIGDVLNDPTTFIRSTLPFMGASQPYVRSFEDYNPPDMTIQPEAPYQHANDRMKHVLHAQLSALITSAIQTVLFPPVRVGVAATTDRVIVPIVLFRNSGKTQLSDQELLRLVDADLIKKSLASVLLPTQEVFVVVATHDINEHPDVAVAVSAATKHFTKIMPAATDSDKHTILQVPFLDSSVLVAEMKQAGDRLVQGLLQDAGRSGSPLMNLDVFASESKHVDTLQDSLLAALQEPGLEGIAFKVVPVFVLENLHQHTSRVAKPIQPLLDKKKHVVFADDVVIVLRSDEPVDAFNVAKGAWETVTLHETDQHITAGLYEALIGYSGPQYGASAVLALDTSWVAGIHPFDPLGVSVSISPVLQHAAWKMLVAAKAIHITSIMPPLFREVEAFLQRQAFAMLPPSNHLKHSTHIVDFINWLETIDPTTLPLSVYQLTKDVSSAAESVEVFAKRVQEGYGSGNLEKTMRALDALRFSLVAVARGVAHRLEHVTKSLEGTAGRTPSATLTFDQIRAHSGSNKSPFTRTDVFLLFGVSAIALSWLVADFMFKRDSKKQR